MIFKSIRNSKSLLNTLFFLLASLVVSAQKKAPSKTINLLIGTYTHADSGRLASKGIYVYRFNSQTGALSYKNEIDGIDNPSYLCLSKNQNFVYSVNESRPGKVSSFSFNSSTGKLTPLNQVLSGGDDPCYISIDHQNRAVFLANYSGGNLSAIPLKEDGSLDSQIQVIQHEGKGPNLSRQEKAHVHTTVLSPDEKFLLATDLGTDSLSVYKVNFNKKTPILNPNDSLGIGVKQGNGPRHLAFLPNGKMVYLIQELTSTVNSYAYQNGKLKLKQSLNFEPKDFVEEIGAADIHISPDGKFLYASDRGKANVIAIFSISTKGLLRFITRQSCGGKTPRNFVIDPSGNFLLVANQNSDQVILFMRNKKTGFLKKMPQIIHVGSPVCLKFD